MTRKDYVAIAEALRDALLEQRDKLVKALRACVEELQSNLAAAQWAAFVKKQVALKGTALIEAERVLAEVEHE